MRGTSEWGSIRVEEGRGEILKRGGVMVRKPKSRLGSVGCEKNEILIK